MPPKSATTGANKPISAAADKGKRVFTPRPPRSKEERLPKLYHGLTEQVENGHFEGAIRTCKTSTSRSAGLYIWRMHLISRSAGSCMPS